MSDIRKALEQAEIGLANLVSYQSSGNTPSIHEYGQANRALIVVRAALSQPQAAQPAPVAWRARIKDVWFHAANRDALVTSLRLQLARGPDELQPLYATPPTEPQAAQPEAVAWLIESRFTGSSVTWWNGLPEGAGVSYTSDPNAAVRFSRKEDAERVAQHMHMVKVTEHVWI